MPTCTKSNDRTLLICNLLVSYINFYIFLSRIVWLIANVIFICYQHFENFH
ncbi:hypothetical protein DSUL_160005 [Desulfovibrionales bacterium]